MRNEEHFKELVNKLNNIDHKYDNELNIFVNYLVSNGLIDRCFDLTPYDMDKYFESLINVKIGSSSSLNRHIAALSALFEYLYSEKLGFRSLHGYINMNDFRNKYLVKLDAGSKKEIIPKDILIDVLNKIDTYYKEHKTEKENSKFYHFLLARLYVELSLIIPLKPNDMAKLKLGDIKNPTFNEVEYNGIFVKLPKSVRYNIIETIKYAEKYYQVKYTEKVALFEFLYAAVNMQPQSNTISDELKKLHRVIGATEMLKTYKTGTKNMSQYPVESYKKTAIFEMLNNGVNILYLKQLTGLDIGTLLSDCDLDNLKSNVDIKSQNINNGIVNSSYFGFL